MTSRRLLAVLVTLLVVAAPAGAAISGPSGTAVQSSDGADLTDRATATERNATADRDGDGKPTVPPNATVVSSFFDEETTGREVVDPATPEVAAAYRGRGLEPPTVVSTTEEVTLPDGSAPGRISLASQVDSVELPPWAPVDSLGVGGAAAAGSIQYRGPGFVTYSPNESGPTTVTSEYAVDGVVTQTRDSSAPGDSVSRVGVQSVVRVRDVTTGEVVATASRTHYDTTTPGWGDLLVAAVDGTATSLFESVLSAWFGQRDRLVAGTPLESTEGDAEAREFAAEDGSLSVRFDAVEGHQYFLEHETRAVTLGVGLGANATAETSVTVTVDRMVIAPAEDAAAPTAAFLSSPAAPTPGSTVTFEAAAASDPDAAVTDYQWDLDGDGTTDATGPTATRRYDAAGATDVSLTVADAANATNSSTRPVVVAPAPERGETFDVALVGPHDGLATYDVAVSGPADVNVSTVTPRVIGQGDYTADGPNATARVQGTSSHLDPMLDPTDRSVVLYSVTFDRAVDPGNVTLSVAGATTTGRDVSRAVAPERFRLVSPGAFSGTTEETEVSVVLDGAPTGLRLYTVTLASTTGAPITGLAPDLVDGQRFQTTEGGVGRTSVVARGVDVSNETGPFEGRRTLFTATFAGSQSAANFSLSVTDIEDDAGAPLRTDRVSLVVGNGSVPAPVDPLPGSGAVGPPTDANGDGVVEDVDGNGVEEFADVVALAFVDASRLTARQREMVDYDDDGDFDFADVLELAFGL
jgi:PKD repeat protein